METRTVRVRNISDLAGEREIRDFFSFSGDIEQIEIRGGRDTGSERVAFVTFKEPRALEIALLLSGATIVDRVVNIASVENYVPTIEEQVALNEAEIAIPDSMTNIEGGRSSPSSGQDYVNKAHVVVSTVLAKGSALKQDAFSKAKAFDEKHRLSATASERVISFDRRVGLSEKFNVGISIVNEKVKSVDQKLHVSDKTMSAIIAAERKLNDTGTAVKTNRYVSAGTSWLNGAFGKVAKAGHIAGARTKEKFQLAVSNLTAKDPVVAA
ncbi:binding partner of ACD11 1-like [Zingiber officinale]|uniref:binding partner of ACD11 1-like n=1 Tax=Zingiber officinale TaxID=94328 RepID=UPI001C4AC16D|nr:binding partner of ACD11 1-like [Zingiber officinale]